MSSRGASTSSTPATSPPSTNREVCPEDVLATYPRRLLYGDFCHKNGFFHRGCPRHARSPAGQAHFERYHGEYAFTLQKVLAKIYPVNTNPKGLYDRLRDEGALAHLKVFPRARVFVPCPARAPLNPLAASFVPEAAPLDPLAPSFVPGLVPVVAPAPPPASVLPAAPASPTAPTASGAGPLPTPSNSPVRCRKTLPASLVTPWKKEGLCDGCDSCRDGEVDTFGWDPMRQMKWIPLGNCSCDYCQVHGEGICLVSRVLGPVLLKRFGMTV